MVRQFSFWRMRFGHRSETKGEVWALKSAEGLAEAYLDG
jgi:hypothetical protein